MVFHSYKFILLFLPAVLICYKLPERLAEETRVKVRSALLIVASVFFIVGFGWQCAVAVACSIAVNGCVARRFLCGEAEGNDAGKEDNNTKENDSVKNRGLQKSILSLVIILDIATLVLLKVTTLPLPVGLSFYTFTQIAFLVDAYRGEITSFTIPEYLLHVLFFPKFLQGPIMRMEDTRRMITSRLQNPMTARNLLNGALLFSLGLFKKTLLADTLGRCVDTAYSLIPHLTRPDAVITILVFVAQLYFDFSAYCDMGRGCAWMMGLDLPDNFLQPLRTRNIVEYWKRWHMSLTGFFTRYLYIPLGGSRRGNARRYLNVLIVFLVSGFWHGTGVTFLVWGALHGVAYVCVTAVLGTLERERGDSAGSFVQEEKQQKDNSSRIFNSTEKNGTGKVLSSGTLPGAIQVAINYIFVSICYVFFRADNIADALKLFERTYGAAVSFVSDTIADTFYLDEIWYVVKVLPLANWEYRKYLCMAAVLLASAVLLFFVPDAKTLVLRNDERMQEGGSARSVLFVLLCTVLFVWALVSTSGVATYIYVNF